MARIKIKDLPRDIKISREELKRIKGGAQVDMFMKITPVDIKGESQDDKHKDEIDVLSY